MPSVASRVLDRHIIRDLATPAEPLVTAERIKAALEPVLGEIAELHLFTANTGVIRFDAITPRGLLETGAIAVLAGLNDEGGVGVVVVADLDPPRRRRVFVD